MKSVEAHGAPTDPYRIFFPLGILFGVAGTSIWIAYYFGLTQTYSGVSHAYVQIDGFLYAFIAGFLLTAIPRFTRTEEPSLRAQYALAAILTLAVAAFEARIYVIGHTLFLVAHAMLITLIARRFLRRRSPPPETFIFVGAGLLAGMLGASINAGMAWGFWPPAGYLLARRLMTEGMTLFLVVGVGGFLGPRLLGFAALPDLQGIGKVDAQQRAPFAMRYKSAIYAGAAGTMLVSLVAEYGFEIANAVFIRVAIATAIVLATVQPWKPPAARTTLAWSVWSAEWLLIIGLWLIALFPRYRVDLLHVIFIGGFTLLILAVAMRVSLSHGGHPLAYEKRSWPLRIGIVTGLIALLARIGAPFAPNVYFGHLAWAAILWIAGMLFWGIHLVRLIVRNADARTATRLHGE